MADTRKNLSRIGFIVCLFMAMATFCLAGTTVKGSKSNTSERQQAGEQKTFDKAAPKLITGKVVKVDPKAKTFTILSKGKEITIEASKLKALPKTGEVVDVTYTDTGGQIRASNLNLSKSNID